MKQNKRTLISCLACTLIIAVVMGICLCCSRESESVQVAENCEQLQLFISYPYGTERINIWKDEGGYYYFFLPSGIGNCKLTFGNLSDTGNIRMAGMSFGVKDDISSFLASLSSGQMIETIVETAEVSQPEMIQLVFLWSENIPAMFIDTKSGSVESIYEDKEAKEAASMRLVDSAGNGCYNGDLEYIKTRGNSSWFFPKKSYQIKFGGETGLLNMPSAKKWILLSNFVDDSLMKNEIIYRYAENYTRVPSIHGQYVDLYVNGDYCGNYYLCEKVEVGSNRLKLTDLEAATEAVNPASNYSAASLYVSEDGRIKATQGLEDPADITGGYLLEHISDEDFEVSDNAFQTITGEHYDILSPCPATVEQAEYICGLFDEMETAMEQEDGVNPATGRHFSEYLDLDMWTSKYVMEEVFHDPDATTASMFFYKECDTIDPLICSGPMWDYDRAMGSYGMHAYTIDDARQVGNYGIYVRQLMRFDEVASMVYEKLENEMVPYVENLARADIYKLNQLIQASAEMDRVRWNGVNGYYIDRNASVNYLSYFLETKTKYLQDVWLGDENYCTVSFLDYFGNICASYKVKKGECLEEAPSVGAYNAIFTGWYVRGESIPYVPGLPVLEDVTYESDWIDIEIILQNGMNILDKDLSQMDPVILEHMAEVLREMQNGAQEAAKDLELSDTEE